MDAVAQKQQTLRSMVRDIVGDHSINQYRALDVTYTLRDTAVIMSLLVGAVATTIYLHSKYGPTAILAMPLVIPFTAIAFNWINVQIHEASHTFLLPNKTWNDIYCNLVLGAWVFQDVDTYRATHANHHAYLHSERDPDRWAYTEHVGSIREVLSGLAEDLLLVTVYRRYRQVAKLIGESSSRIKVPRYTLFAKVLAQAVVLGIFLYGCGPWGAVYYLSCHAYSLLGVLPVLVRIRTVVQHHDEHLDGQRTPWRFVSRTTVAPFLEFILVGARMDYHFEHHLFPTLPYYNLRQMHRQLNDAGFFQLPSVGDGLTLRTENYLHAYADLATSK